jgi:hypothetical protein
MREEREADLAASRAARPWKKEADAYDERLRAAKAKSPDSGQEPPQVEKPERGDAAARAAPKTGSPKRVSSPSMAPDEFIARFNPRCFYHFTDTRNLAQIEACEGLLSMSTLRERGIKPAAPGGDANSQRSDSDSGLDRYVHLCLCNQNPMEFRARQDGRIQQSRFLEIDREIVRLPGVRFTAGMANRTGTSLLTLEEAFARLDFAAAYDHLDWSSETEMRRVLLARKFELLVPDGVPSRLIRNL